MFPDGRNAVSTDSVTCPTVVPIALCGICAGRLSVKSNCLNILATSYHSMGRHSHANRNLNGIIFTKSCLPFTRLTIFSVLLIAVANNRMKAIPKRKMTIVTLMTVTLMTALDANIMKMVKMIRLMEQ